MRSFANQRFMPQNDNGHRIRNLYVPTSNQDSTGKNRFRFPNNEMTFVSNANMPISNQMEIAGNSNGFSNNQHQFITANPPILRFGDNLGSDYYV